MSRKLASIQKIWNLSSIEGADRIELAHVLGWQCVVNKGQFQPMDKAVYLRSTTSCLFGMHSSLCVNPATKRLTSWGKDSGCGR